MPGWIAAQLTRPRPSRVDIIGDWSGFSHPAVTVAAFAATVTAVGFALRPPGRWRRIWFIAGGLAGTLLVIARLYLGVDHFTDGVFAALFGAALTTLVFRVVAPDEAFPVPYDRGRTAHLPVTGARGVRLRTQLQSQLLDPGGPTNSMVRSALQGQLGCELVSCQVMDITPFGLAGSAGPTPLVISVEGRIDGELFARLYAMNHLRSDRWYKLGRAILYGRLEDEHAFTSVRRLVEYEDYMLRVMADAAIPSARPHGIVELIPDRECLIVTESFAGASEIQDAVVDKAVADDALGVVRKLWDAGLAHRDLKPANVLVVGGRVKLIDVAFAEVRPSRWRETVDLANMMLILALHLGPDVVYERALLLFTLRDIAEALAAKRSVTIPSQLRGLVAEHEDATGQDLLEALRDLAPSRPPIAIQRWSARRFTLTGAVVVSFLLSSASWSRTCGEWVSYEASSGGPRCCLGGGGVRRWRR